VRCPGVVLGVVGGVYERVAIRYVECVGGMATCCTGAATRRVAMKTRRRKTKVKRRNLLTAEGRRGPAAELQNQLDRRTHQLAEAQKRLAETLDQQAATSEEFHPDSGSTLHSIPGTATLSAAPARRMPRHRPSARPT
jgi:hypothetical protein